MDSIRRRFRLGQQSYEASIFRRYRYFHSVTPELLQLLNSRLPNFFCAPEWFLGSKVP
jgi:hypothetical protein